MGVNDDYDDYDDYNNDSGYQELVAPVIDRSSK